MSEFKLLVLWTDSAGNTFELDDVLSVTVSRKNDLKNNRCEVLLKNNPRTIRKYFNGRLLFNTDDKVEVFARFTPGVIDPSSSDDLLFSGRLTEYSYVLEEGKTHLKLLLMDSVYSLLNRLWVGVETDTPPNLIVNKLIPWVNQTAGNNVITAFLGAGSVQDTPFVAASYPQYTLSKVYKPVFEVIDELSQPGITGDGSRPYKYFVDRNNVFRWFYPNDPAKHYIVEGSVVANGSVSYLHPVNGVETITDNNAHFITKVDVKLSVADVTNFIIYKAGTDLENEQIMNFAFDPLSGAPSVKDSFRSWEDIARSVKRAEAEHGNLSQVSGDEYSIVNSSGTTSWGVSYSSDSEYNDVFRDYVNSIARSRCNVLFARKGSPRFKGRVELKGENVFDVNDFAVISLPSIGVVKTLFNIVGVKHTVRRSGWFTSLEVEEDRDKQLLGV